MPLRKRMMRKKKRTGNHFDLLNPGASLAPSHSISAAFPCRGSIAVYCVGCVLILGLLAPCLAAKQKPLPTKTISGDVLDQSNHNVAGASVFLTDLETHHTDAIYSGADGTYNFSGLNPHDDYRVQAKYRGLASEIRSTSSFDTRPRVVLNLVLAPPGSQKQASTQ